MARGLWASAMPIHAFCRSPPDMPLIAAPSGCAPPDLGAVSLPIAFSGLNFPEPLGPIASGNLAIAVRYAHAVENKRASATGGKAFAVPPLIARRPPTPKAGG